MKKLFATLMLVLLMIGAPVFAQTEDVTDTPTPVEEVVATATAVPVPDVTIINQLPDETDASEDPQVVTWEKIALVLAVIGGISALIVSYVNWRNQNPNATGMEGDAKLAELIDARREDRVWMSKLENSYAALVQNQKDVIESLSETLKYVATLTPIQSDDKLSELLEDIQEPGVDEDFPGTPEPQPAPLPPRV